MEFCAGIAGVDISCRHVNRTGCSDCGMYFCNYCPPGVALSEILYRLRSSVSWVYYRISFGKQRIPGFGYMTEDIRKEMNGNCKLAEKGLTFVYACLKEYGGQTYFIGFFLVGLLYVLL